MNYLVGVDLKFLDTATMAWGEEILKKGMQTDILRGLLHEPEPPPCTIYRTGVKYGH